jgi:hypothetical protein
MNATNSIKTKPFYATGSVDQELAGIDSVALREELVRKALTAKALKALGWFPALYEDTNEGALALVIRGGRRSGAVNPTGARRLFIRNEGDLLLVLHGDKVMASEPFGVDAVPAVAAAALHAAVMKHDRDQDSGSTELVEVTRATQQTLNARFAEIKTMLIANGFVFHSDKFTKGLITVWYSAGSTDIQSRLNLLFAFSHFIVKALNTVAFTVSDSIRETPQQIAHRVIDAAQATGNSASASTAD